MRHACRLIASPWAGVFGTDVDSARHYDPHWHSAYGIGFIERGAHRSMSGRGVVDAYAGDVITCNPGEVHDGRPLVGQSRRWRMVYMEPSVMASMSGAPGTPWCGVQLTDPVCRDRAAAAAIRRLLQRLQHWSDSPRPSRDEALRCEESLVEACGLVLRHHSTGTPHDPEARSDIRRARERLADDPANPPSLSELAALVGLSKYQLMRRFERAYGMTPHAWLRQVRVERARAAIARGASLAHVAAECGFADQSHMTRAFVLHFGFTPGAWRPVARGRSPVASSGCNRVQDTRRAAVSL